MSSHIHVSPTGLFWENTFFNLALAVYLIAVLCYLAHLLGKEQLGRFASHLLRLSFLVHTAFIVTRAINVQRVPFVGSFEFGNMFVWATVLVYLWSEWRMQEQFYAVGAFVTPLAMLYLAYLTVVPLLFPAIRISRVHSRLAPVLQNKWLTVHVSTSIFGYAGFTLAFAAAVMWLLKRYLKSDHLITRALPGSKTLEEYMYRGAAFGFLFQSAMIITGAIWADISWGRYWGWDPKEMWALITWFVYAVYLHARFTRGWTGLRTVVLVMLGWVCMVFTWIGVAWLLSGLHSFG